MDPLYQVHEHLHDSILLHLSVLELLDYSLVSKKWYKAIGNSSAAMKRVWLNVGDRFNEPKKEDLRAFRASDRNYQNFKMSEIENGLQILLFPKRSWRRAQIDIQSFTNFKDYVNLLRVFNETIVELDLFDMDIESSDYTQGTLEFSCLRKLRIGFVSSIALRPFMKTLQSMNKLVLENISDLGCAGDNSTELMTSFLVLQPQLTHLHISAEAFTKAFKNIDAYHFQLVYLLLEYSEKGDTEESQTLLDNFGIFFSNQKKLEWLTLCEWTSTFVVEKVFNHESIRRVSFDYFEDSIKFDSLSSKLPVNGNIKQIDFDCEDLRLTWLKPVLDATPKVEVLYFFHITSEILEFVFNMKYLKTVKYCSIFHGFKAFYDNLKFKQSGNFELVEHKFLDLKKEI